MSLLRLVLCVFLLAGLGCRKRRADSPVPVDAATPSAAGSHAVSTPAPPQDVPVETALHHLNNAVRNYYAEKTAMPATLEEVYRSGYLKERFNPPPGKQFVINPKTQAVEVR